METLDLLARLDLEIYASGERDFRFYMENGPRFRPSITNRAAINRSQGRVSYPPKAGLRGCRPFRAPRLASRRSRCRWSEQRSPARPENPAPMTAWRGTRHFSAHAPRRMYPGPLQGCAVSRQQVPPNRGRLAAPPEVPNTGALPQRAGGCPAENGPVSTVDSHLSELPHHAIRRLRLPRHLLRASERLHGLLSVEKSWIGLLGTRHAAIGSGGGRGTGPDHSVRRLENGFIRPGCPPPCPPKLRGAQTVVSLPGRAREPQFLLIASFAAAASQVARAEA